MARNITITFEDGTTHQYAGVPDNVTPDQVHQRAAQEFGKGITNIDGGKAAQPAQPTDEQNMRASILGRFAAGMAEPIVGAGQLLAHGISAISPKGSYGEDLAGVVDSYWKDQSTQQEEAKKAANVGTDVAGFVGNVLSPTNALLAAKGITAASTIGRVAQGAGLGASGAAMQPVLDGGDYAGTKSGQLALGAATGGAATKLIDAVAGKAAAKLARKFRPEDSKVLGVKASQHTDEAINEALKETGMDAASIPHAQMQAIRDQVIKGFKDGKELDAAALLRKQDFDALGMAPLQGQITRDPLQFAQERNLRGAVPEVAQRLETMGQQLRSKIGGVAGDAVDNYTAGNKLVDALRSTDQSMRANVTELYNQARNSAGKDLELPLQGLAQDYQQVLHDFGTDKIPSGVRNHLDDLGLLTGKQNKLFTVEDSDKLLKVINDNMSNDPAVNTALGRLRNAVKDTVLRADDTGGVFAPAVKAASERFKLHDAIPAMKAAADGTASPDNFVQKFVVNGKTDEVKRMAELLRTSSPEAYDEARNQIGETLKRAAFGENPVGDGAFSPDRFAKALRTMGKDKLGAFFNPDEVDGLNRMARVGAYINKVPDVAPVNNSNTLTAALMNGPLLGLASHIPGYGAAVGTAKAMTGAVKNQMAATNAMNAKVPFATAELTPQQARLVALLRAAGAVGGGVGGAQLAE